MPPRIRQPETRLTAEYLAQRYPRGGYSQRVPLGPVLLPQGGNGNLAGALGQSRPFRPEVDAVVPEPGRLVLIEVKLLRLVDGLAKLPMYAALVPRTPELIPYRELPVTMRLVAPWTSENAEAMARAAGIEIEVFAPAWVAEYMDQQQNYWSQDARRRREDRRRLLDNLGLD